MLAADCVLIARRHKTYPKRVLIEVDSKENGKLLAGQLQNVYTDNTGVFDTSDGWRDFSLRFPSPARAGDVIKDINGAIREYKEAHPEQFGYVVNQPDTYEGDDEEDDEEEKTESKDYTTYIVIGAAVLAIIILLLWDSRR